MLPSPCKASAKKDNGDTVFISDLAKDLVVTSKPLSPTQTPVSKAPSGGNNKESSGTSTPSGECSANLPVEQRPPGCQ